MLFEIAKSVELALFSIKYSDQDSLRCLFSLKPTFQILFEGNCENTTATRSSFEHLVGRAKGLTLNIQVLQPPKGEWEG